MESKSTSNKFKKPKGKSQNLKKRMTKKEGFVKGQIEETQLTEQAPDETLKVDFQIVTPDLIYLPSLSNMMKIFYKDITPASYHQLAKEILEQDDIGALIDIEGDEIMQEAGKDIKSCYAVCTLFRIEDYRVSYNCNYFSILTLF